ncbi:MAG: Hpt domain-containing protein [bacterium]|nr:Hpt domain-containing protein [bacterium]
MTTETQSLDSVLNLNEAMTNLDGDAELLEEIMEIFLDTAGEQLQSIQDAIKAGDIKQVAVQSHGMKGGASNFCAKKFVRSALRLELKAKDENLDGAQELLDGMRENFAELQEVAKFINWQEVENNWEE